MSLTLQKMYALFGRVVLLPVPLGEKGPMLKAWPKITYEETQEPAYKRELEKRIEQGGNIGVACGPLSDRLLAYDIDEDNLVEKEIERVPWLADTTRTRGARGCQFFLRLEPGGQYPNTQAVIRMEHGELRLGGAGGAQSIIWGVHPKGMRYKITHVIGPLEIGLAGLYELCPQLWAKHESEGEPEPEDEPKRGKATDARVGDAKLQQEADRGGDLKLQEEALIAEITAQCGQAAFFNAYSQMTAINERFWATLQSRENIIVHEPDEGEFYRYDDESGLYVPATDDNIRAQLAERIFQASKTWPGFSQLQRFQGGRVLQGVIAHLRGVTESRAFQEPPCHYIHCANCVLELTDGGYVRREFSPRFRSRNRSPVVYDPKAKCPRFEKEVLEVLKDEDKELVQKVFGGMLLGHNIAQKILMLHGIGGTGKTTLALILQGIVGSENISELRTAHLDDRFEIGRFLGKSLLIGVDVDSDFLSGPAISRLKGLVGGDFLDAEKKSSNRNFRLHGRFNVLITSNTRLRIRLQGDQSAWRRRLLLIPYEQERDGVTIRDFYALILRQEAPGVLNWGLEGLAKLRSDLEQYGDIHLVERQHQAIENVLEESDSLRIFLNRCIQRTDGQDNLTVDEIVTAYLDFCVGQGWVPMSPGVVQRHLESLMLEYFASGRDKHIERDGKAQRGFRHVRFRPE